MPNKKKVEFKRIVCCVSPEDRELLVWAKKNIFYNESWSEMYRSLIRAGLEVVKKGN